MSPARGHGCTLGLVTNDVIWRSPAKLTLQQDPRCESLLVIMAQRRCYSDSIADKKRDGLLGKKFLYDLNRFNPREALVEALVSIGESHVVDTQAM